MLRLNVLTGTLWYSLGTCQLQARALILEDGVKWDLLIVWKNNKNNTTLLGSGQKSLAMEVAGGPRTERAILILLRGHVVRLLKKTLTFVPVDLGCTPQWWKCFLLQWTSVNGKRTASWSAGTDTVCSASPGSQGSGNNLKSSQKIGRSAARSWTGQP